MKYKYTGAGLGIPGLPHEITADEAQRYEAEYKEAEKKIRANLQEKAKQLGRKYGEVDEIDLANGLFGYPWTQLQAALANGSYKEDKAEAPKDGK